PAQLTRMREAVAEFRRTVCELIQQHHGPGVPADATEDECNRARVHIEGELLQSLARGEFPAFLDTHYGLEVMPDGPFWLHAGGDPTQEAKRVLITGAAPSARPYNNGPVAGIVKVRRKDF